MLLISIVNIVWSKPSSSLDCRSGNDLRMLKAEFETLQDGKRAKSSPYRFNTGNDQYRWMETVATNLIDDPSIGGIVTNSHDITDTIRHLQAIEYQNKVLQEISWMQSHEVRAPLSAILGLINLIKEEQNDPGLQKFCICLMKQPINSTQSLRKPVRLLMTGSMSKFRHEYGH